MGKRKFLLVSTTIFALATVFIVYRTFFVITVHPEEKLARVRCGSCHMFPEPALADKNIWIQYVLPRMATLVGINKDGVQRDSVSSAEFEKIVKYYYDDAPVHVRHNGVPILDTIKQFDLAAAPFHKELIVMLHYDSAEGKIFAGDQKGWLYELDRQLKITDSIKLQSPPVRMERRGEDLIVLTVGTLMPSDDKTGALSRVNMKARTSITLIDSLARPVDFKILGDSNHTSYLICSFGHLTGSLAIYDGTYPNIRKQTLDPLPGARKVTLVDWDKDGLQDIVVLMAQGDERILLFRAIPGGYVKKILLRFPPIYGSSSFSVVDFNRDGQPDVLYTNGDNADYSQIVKPYHGIRLFLNENGKLQEKWSWSMPGAWDTRVNDFDRDGDLDIIAISFFPDNEHTPSQNVIYFENLGDYNFKSHIDSFNQSGKWIVMEMMDVDQDGNQDILLGSFQYGGLGVNPLIPRDERVDLMFLKNTFTENARR